jgi:WXG100 family type VII secretion target
MTSQILVNPEEVSKMTLELYHKNTEIEEMIQRLVNMMANLKGSFRGHLADQIFVKWDELYPSLTKNTKNLRAAGDILKKASDAFRQVDETRI